VNNTAPVTQRAKRAYRHQLKQLQNAEYGPLMAAWLRGLTVCRFAVYVRQYCANA
jgi:hypothetical protein